MAYGQCGWDATHLSPSKAIPIGFTSLAYPCTWTKSKADHQNQAIKLLWQLSNVRHFIPSLVKVTSWSVIIPIVFLASLSSLVTIRFQHRWNFYKVFQICTVADHYWSVLLPLSLSFTIRGRVWQSSCNVRRQTLSLGAGMWSHLPILFIYFFLAEMTQYLGYFWNCTIVNTISVSLFPYADLVKWINTSKGQIVWVLGLHWFYFRVFYVFVLFVCLFSICLLESTKDREESDTFQVHIRRIAESFL